MVLSASFVSILFYSEVDVISGELTVSCVFRAVYLYFLSPLIVNTELFNKLWHL